MSPEAGGVLRRLPLQSSTARQGFFPFWNIREGSEQTLGDLCAQMLTTNFAWNMCCTRCHVTELRIRARAPGNRRGHVSWLESGVGCEAGHGPGSLHATRVSNAYCDGCHSDIALAPTAHTRRSARHGHRFPPRQPSPPHDHD